MLRKFLMGLCLSVGIVSYGVLAQAATLDVCPSGCTYSSIQDAIDAAVDGDTVLVDDGTYTENINFLGKAITVISVNGPESTIIDGNASGSVVTFDSGEGTNSVLSGFTICNGVADNGGGIYCDNSSPTITNCTISGNSAVSEGGGIYCTESSPTITNCTISGNSADRGGGIYCYGYSSPTITNCTINDNSAWDGGGIHCEVYSSPTITNCTISGNSAEGWNGDGGGISCWQESSPTITNCIISGNSAVSDGGGIYCTESSPTITNCTISGNSADEGVGGGISCCYDSSPIITNCTISDNSAVSEGGGICCYGYSSPTITNCTINDNSAGDGGGIHCEVYSSPTITNCTISGNSAEGWDGDGGGISCWQESSPTITNCIISGNSAVSEGGGIYCEDYPSPTITNCTISGNSAGQGGGIFCYDSSPTITNCTISGNSAVSEGGGIYCVWESSPTVVNSILWGDSPDEIYLEYDSTIDITYSDIEGGWAGVGNIDADPLFVGDGDYHLTTNSPCIDAGTDNITNYPTLPTDDIDGDARPQGAGYDMGSDEYVAEVIPPTPDIKANGEDGTITITTNDTLSITVELNPGDYDSEDADWWHVADTPFGWYWYNVSTNSWVPGIQVTYQGPLFNLTPPFETLNIVGLPTGTYIFYFGVDIEMNGLIDFDKLYYDSVVVNIE
jgi:parallel beta-helix repeat protein